MGHGRNGMVVQIQSCHGAACYSPRTGVLGAYRFEMGFQQGQGVLCMALLDE